MALLFLILEGDQIGRAEKDFPANRVRRGRWRGVAPKPEAGPEPARVGGGAEPGHLRHPGHV